MPVLNESGKLIKQLRQNASYFVESPIGLEMMQVQSGSFKMGTSWEIIEAAYKDAKKYKDVSQEDIAAEMPQHQVKVPGFFMSKNEITQSQWQAVMGSLPEIDQNFRGANLPVVKVSWRQANAFCQKLSQMTGKIYRLPTEANGNTPPKPVLIRLLLLAKRSLPTLLITKALFLFCRWRTEFSVIN